jgi:hypothetical protein
MRPVVTTCIMGFIFLGLLVPSVTAQNTHRGSTAAPFDVGLCAAKATPTELIATRDSVGRVPSFLKHAQPFTRSSRRMLAIQRLYAAVCSLRVLTTSASGKPSVLSCNSWGVEVHLVFLRDKQRLLRVTADTAGCPLLYRAPRAFRGGSVYFMGHIPFWSLVAHALRVPKGDILPQPTGNTPSA